MLTLDSVKTLAAPIFEQHNIIKATLFGSVARGEATQKSDCDIIVECPQGMSTLDLIGVQLDLEDALGVTVDLISAGGASEEFREQIREDEVLIYEREPKR